MTGTLAAWLRGRTRREQRLILAMLAMAALVFAWLLVVRPLGDALAAARERYGAAVVALAEARSRSEAIGRLEKSRPPPLAEPLAAILAEAASGAGFPLSRIEPEGNGESVTLAMAAVRPQAFFAWVEDMQGRRGLIVERLTASSNSDRTLSVQVTFRARGG
jgi:general secretion pathway protein M